MKVVICIILLVVVLLSSLIKYNNTNSGSRNVFVSEKLMSTLSKLSGFDPEVAKAAAPIPPFIVLRRPDHPMNEIRINHEHIHHVQMLESLGLFQLRAMGEYWYARMFLGKPHMEAYLRKATEQEAYLHQHNPNYLRTRPIRSTLQYIKQKTSFHLENFQVVVE